MKENLKVVFLDIDGVLQPRTQYRFEHIRNGEMPQLCADLTKRLGYDYSALMEASSTSMYDIAAVYYDWDKESVALMKELLESEGAVIVLSSDWREFGMDVMEMLLGIWGLDRFIYGATDYQYAYNYRNNERCGNKNNQETHSFWIKRNEDSKPWIEKLRNFFKETEGGGFIKARIAEIREYLDRHTEVTDYVVIDDLNLCVGNNGHAIVTSERFRKGDLRKAKKILSMHDGPYPLPPEAISPELVSYREKYINPEVFLPNNGYVKGSD